jgi:carboxyl-terminal processing protease
MRILFKIMVLAVFILAIISVSYVAGFGTATYLNSSGLVSRVASQWFNQNTPDIDEEEYFGVFWEAWHFLEQDFFGELPNAQQMTYAALRGVLGVLDDPHTAFVEPKPRQREREDLQGSFGGIGAWVRVKEDGSIFLTPMEDSPAMRAGVQDGDVVVKVDDTEITPETSLDDVLSLIRGPIGSPVTLTLSRADQREPVVAEIIREKIETPTVAWEILEDDIGYANISLFGERTTGELQGAIRELKKQGATKLILDLRNNPGGLLDIAIEVASQFMKDSVVLYEQRKEDPEITYSTRKGGVAPEIPMVVLVNGGTASASEIVAGALQDNERAILIGERTFGKGSVQYVRDLSDGSSIHITVAYWLTPNHHQISGNGLSPDIEVSLSAEERDSDQDTQLNRALNYLKTIQQ